MKKILSCCPVVNKEIRSLVPSNFQFQPGKPVSAFDASIYWLQESEVSLNFYNGNKLLQNFGTFDDRDGYLTSLDHAYRLAKQIIAANGLNTFSSECLKVKIDITQTPVFELFTEEVKFSWGRNATWRQYESVADDWNEIEFSDQVISSKNVLKPMKRKAVLQQHLVFSSKIPSSQFLNAIDVFKKKWQVQTEDKPNYSKRRK